MPDEEQSPITHGVRNRLWRRRYTNRVATHNNRQATTLSNIASLITAAATLIGALTPLISKMM